MNKLTRELTIIGLMALLVFTAGFRGCEKKGTDKDWNFLAPTTNQKELPSGLRFASHGSISDAIMQGSQRGFDKAVRIAGQEPNNYKVLPRPSQFTIGLWPRSPRCINPGYTIRADGSEWDGTDFDKDPAPGIVRLCIAGIARQYAFGTGGETAGTFGMVVVDDVSSIENVVWFETEHEILYAVDYPRFDATSGIHAHPLMGEGDALAATKSPYVAFNYTAATDAQIGPMKVIKGDKFCVLITK